MNRSSNMLNKANRLRNIKITLEYDGTDFSGWQTQTGRNGRCNTSRPSQRTVQNEIEKTLKKILKNDTKLSGSGRTDSGVHALGQVANFKTDTSMPVDEILNALNANLPVDIAVKSVEEMPQDFHARYSVRSKTYRYTILNENARCAQQRNYCLYYPYKLNVRKMREEAKALIGRKDFKSFTASDPAKRNTPKNQNTIRTVKQITITHKGPLLTVDIRADGFLYKMVRNIIGTLLEVGQGKLEKGSIKKILSQKKRDAAGKTAKAHGLALLEVQY